MSDTEWRLQRIPSLEAGIYAVGRLELAGLFSDEIEFIRNRLIEAFRQKRHEQFDPAEFGFESSREEIHRHAEGIDVQFHVRYHHWQQKHAA